MVTEKYKIKLIDDGNNALKNNLWNDGLKIFNELNEIFPKNHGVLVNLSTCLLKSKHYKECHLILDELEKLSPLNVEVNYLRGSCYEHEKDLDRALESYKKCLRIDKEHFDSWVKCAYILRLKKDFSQSINVYKEILKKTQRVDILIDLAITMHLNDQNNEAITILDQIIAKFPDNELAKGVQKAIKEKMKK